MFVQFKGAFILGGVERKEIVPADIVDAHAKAPDFDEAGAARGPIDLGGLRRVGGHADHRVVGVGDDRAARVALDEGGVDFDFVRTDAEHLAAQRGDHAGAGAVAEDNDGFLIGDVAHVLVDAQPGQILGILQLVGDNVAIPADVDPRLLEFLSGHGAETQNPIAEEHMGIGENHPLPLEFSQEPRADHVVALNYHHAFQIILVEPREFRFFGGLALVFEHFPRGQRRLAGQFLPGGLGPDQRGLARHGHIPGRHLRRKGRGGVGHPDLGHQQAERQGYEK